MAHAEYIYPSACVLALFLFVNVSVDGQDENNPVKQRSATTIRSTMDNETKIDPMDINNSKYGK